MKDTREVAGNRDKTAYPASADTAEVHTPRIFASEACIERCSKLAKAAGDASLQSVCRPDTQFDVLCHEKKMIGCGATVLETGGFDQGYGDYIGDSDHLFAVNIRRIPGGNIPIREIALAIGNGIQPHHPSEVL